MYEELLDRPAAARFLKSLYDLRVTAGSLATMATRGGGPRMIKFGRYARYRKADLIDWVRLRSSGLLDSTSSPHNTDSGGLFDFQEDCGDLLEHLDLRDTGQADFDEITRLLEEENGFGEVMAKNLEKSIKTNS